MKEQGPKESFLLSMTLTELSLVLVFLLLLISVFLITDKQEELEALSEEHAESQVELLYMVDQLELLEESVSQYAVLQAAMSEAGFDNPRELVEATSGASQRADNLAEQNENLAGAVAELMTERDQRLQRNEALDRQVADLRARLKNMSRRLGDESGGDGKGMDRPACWADRTGRPQYLYSVNIGEQLLSVTPAWPESRARDVKTIPGATELLGEDMTIEDFKAKVKPVFAWSDAEKCRHFVLITDGAISKDGYKRMLDTVETSFYKYLVK